MTVIYADSVFVLNAAMDYLLFLVTARLAGVTLRRGRYLLAALAGGAYAVAVFLPGGAFLAATPAKLAAGVLLSLLAFGGEERLLRLILLLFAVACALAGCVLALGLLAGGGIPAVNGIFYTDVDAGVLLAAASAAYLVLTVVFRAAAKHGVGGELLPVRVCIGGHVTELTALWDSGNALRDPAGGRPVLVTAPGALNGSLPRELRRLLTPEGLRFPADLLEPVRQAAPELRPRLLPYHTVGLSAGLLLAVRPDWVEICGARQDGVLAALSPTALGTGCTAL
ncbi:MAG: sigma-E processing peptidase SpoIIGA, partial [Oscillospiraceae bacterium]|nr:sigma-E processing peptidase SpoIIGA [Oscillospiraceae bacterium]